MDIDQVSFIPNLLVLCVLIVAVVRGRAIPTNSLLRIGLTPSEPDVGFLFVSGFWTVRQAIRPYSSYLMTFFRVFYGELYFYSDNISIKHITITRPNIHVRYCYPTVWDIPRIGKLKNAYRQQEKIDNQPGLSRPAELYAIWNGKVSLLHEVSLEHPGCCVFWIDAGSIRDFIFENIRFPNQERLVEVFPDKTTRGKMVFTFFRDIHMQRVFPLRLYSESVGAIGGFFGGDFAALEEFYREFWRIHDTLLAQGVFVGADQEIFTTYLVYANETWVQANFETCCCDPWFATWSFWSSPAICFSGRPRLRSSREFVSVD
jgi:hypothetical protein